MYNMVNVCCCYLFCSWGIQNEREHAMMQSTCSYLFCLLIDTWLFLCIHVENIGFKIVNHGLDACQWMMTNSVISFETSQIFSSLPGITLKILSQKWQNLFSGAFSCLHLIVTYSTWLVHVSTITIVMLKR